VSFFSSTSIINTERSLVATEVTVQKPVASKAGNSCTLQTINFTAGNKSKVDKKEALANVKTESLMMQGNEVQPAAIVLEESQETILPPATPSPLVVVQPSPLPKAPHPVQLLGIRGTFQDMKGTASHTPM
jgi:hypothetical protein